MARDMSKQQFRDALKRYGITSEGFMGYYKLPVPDRTCVSVVNAGFNASRRAQLAYLLGELDKAQERFNVA